MASLDLAEYVTHCLHHEIPALWAFHKLPHSAEVMTPMTALRSHPVHDVIDTVIRAPSPLAYVAAWGRALSRIVISPAQHHIHHSYLPQHCHKNYRRDCRVLGLDVRHHLHSRETRKAHTWNESRSPTSQSLAGLRRTIPRVLSLAAAPPLPIGLAVRVTDRGQSRSTLRGRNRPAPTRRSRRFEESGHGFVELRRVLKRGEV
jgi:hypothetical protein